MKLFFNIIIVMLLITWGISYFIIQIGPIAHLILLMAALVALLKIIRAKLHASLPYFTSDIEKRQN